MLLPPAPSIESASSTSLESIVNQMEIAGFEEHEEEQSTILTILLNFNDETATQQQYFIGRSKGMVEEPKYQETLVSSNGVGTWGLADVHINVFCALQAPYNEEDPGCWRQMFIGMCTDDIRLTASYWRSREQVCGEDLARSILQKAMLSFLKT